MISKKQLRNAQRIKALADNLGHLPFNAAGQTTNAVLNLSIPCAQLICADLVTGVRDSFDAVNDQAVEDVTRHVKLAIEFATERHGRGWWNEAGEKYGL